MNMVMNIFKSNSTSTNNSFVKNENTITPITIIQDQLKSLENLQLSPLPSDSSRKHDNEVSSILKKIICNYDRILMDKLENKSETLYQKEPHYWNYISKYFQIPSVKFIHNIYEKLQTPSEKGLAWIYISITEKSLHESLKEIYNQGFEKKFYSKESMMIGYKSEILNLSEKISKFQFSSTKLEIENEYNEYKKMKEIEGAERGEIDLPMSPISKPKNVSYGSIINFDLKEQRTLNANPNNFYYSKTTINLNASNLHSRAENVEFKNTKTMENLFNIINHEDDDLTGVENPDDDDSEFIREKNFPKNTHIIYNNISAGNLNNQMNFNNINNDEKLLSALKQMTKQQNNNENYYVSKYIDIQSCYKENFYNFIFDKKQLGNTSPARKFKSPENRLNVKKENESNLENFNNQGNYNSANNYIPFDKNFRICRKVDKNQFTKKDIIFYKNKEIKMTNSIVFYLNYYYKKEPYIRFNTQITSERPVTIENQNYQCQFCRKEFSTFMHIPLCKVYWCSYYMRFICQNCVCEEYSVIPSFILKSWNFKKFPISKSAKELLTQWYDKPVIHIKQNDPVIKESTLIHNAILIKRKIHKIYDLMKCDSSESFVLNTLGSYKYFVLRENLFSLKDLVDIYEFRLINKLKEYFKKFENHILNDCSVCLYKGGNCVMCMTEEILYAYDVEKVLYCNECKKLFHKKCCSFHPCIINR